MTEDRTGRELTPRPTESEGVVAPREPSLPAAPSTTDDRFSAGEQTHTVRDGGKVDRLADRRQAALQPVPGERITNAGNDKSRLVRAAEHIGGPVAGSRNPGVVDLE